jgi:hypothetical protein
MHRALKIVYSFSDIFVGEARKALFIDLLLTKYFFQLFLHWDPNIRNAFHQLIAFKVCIYVAAGVRLCQASFSLVDDTVYGCAYLHTRSLAAWCNR